MRSIYTLILVALAVTSCKKEVQQTATTFSLQSIQRQLKDSMRSGDYARLDFSRALYNHVDTAGLYFLRVPFKGTSITENFVLVKLNREGSIKEGRIIQLNGGVLGVGDDPVRAGEWEGEISISPLNRGSVFKSAIHKGYIEALHPCLNTREMLLGANVLPEVVVVAYVDRIEPMDISTWLWLNSFFYINNFTDFGGGGGGGESGSGGSYYGSLGGYSGGGGGGTGDLGPGVSSDETILIDLDSYADHSAIDIEQYLKCFDAIPDYGAKCEVGIYADIPVDSDPNKIFDFNTASPGHTFIQIKKTNGSQSVVQNIGFYPKTGWKNALTNAPIDAKFVDDGMHEFNAGYTKILTAEQFKSALTEIRYLKNRQYDIDNFNCTDWALSVFNWPGGYGLDIPLYDIPGNYPSTGTSMPQGVYNKLLEMKKNGDANSDKIQIGFLKAWVTNSNGPCN